MTKELYKISTDQYLKSLNGIITVSPSDFRPSRSGEKQTATAEDQRFVVCEAGGEKTSEVADQSIRELEKESTTSKTEAMTVRG